MHAVDPVDHSPNHHADYGAHAHNGGDHADDDPDPTEYVDAANRGDYAYNGPSGTCSPLSAVQLYGRRVCRLYW